MATGDVTWFDAGLLKIGNKTIDMSGDIRLGLIDSNTTPTAATADPCWGAGGTTNLSTDEVGTATAYPGPVDLDSVSWTLSGGKAVFDATDVSIAQDAGGFTDARWGILYDNAATNKDCVGFVDLGSARSIVTGPLNITWNASGILTLDQAA